MHHEKVLELFKPTFTFWTNFRILKGLFLIYFQEILPHCLFTKLKILSPAVIYLEANWEGREDMAEMAWHGIMASKGLQFSVPPPHPQLHPGNSYLLVEYEGYYMAK